MEKIISYCKACDKTFSEEPGQLKVCPDCGRYLIETNIFADEWEEKTIEEQNKIKTILVKNDGPNMSVSKSGLQGNILARDPSNHRNTVGSILSILGWILVILGVLGMLMRMTKYMTLGLVGASLDVTVYLGVFISGIFILGFAEIIHLLQTIVNRKESR